MQHFFSQSESLFQHRDWGGYLCFLATAESVGSQIFGITAVVRMDKLIHDPHVHDDSDEIFYVLRGHGKQILRNEDGTDSIYDINPGDTVYLTKNRWHGTSNFSDSEQLDMLLVNYFYNGQSDANICGVIPASSVARVQTDFGYREQVLTSENCGTDAVHGEVLTLLPGKVLADIADAAELFFFVISGEVISFAPVQQLTEGTQLFLFQNDKYHIENHSDRPAKLLYLCAGKAQKAAKEDTML